MYEFGILWLIALAVWKAGDLINLSAVRIHALETLLVLALGIGATEALQWNIFAAYGQNITAGWLGILGGGLIVGAAAAALRTGSQLVSARLQQADGEVIHSDFRRRAA